MFSKDSSDGLPDTRRISVANPLSPLDFSAAGDGSADDTAALQDWLDALASGAENGVVPGGYVFCFSSNLVIKLGTKRIEGWGGVLKATANASILIEQDMTDLHLDGLIVDMAHQEGNGLWGFNTARTNITNCRILNCSNGGGILLRGYSDGAQDVYDNLIEGCYVDCIGARDNQFGICVDAALPTVVHGGVPVTQDAASTWMDDNGNADMGAAVGSLLTSTIRARNNRIIGNEILGGYYAISMFFGDNNVIADNLIRDRGTEAASITASIASAGPNSTLTVTAASGAQLRVGAVITGTGVTACRIIAFGTGAGGTGTYTVAGSQTVSSRAMTATFHSGARRGVVLENSCTGNVVSGNQIVNTQSAAILLNYGAADNLVAGNQIYNTVLDYGNPLVDGSQAPLQSQVGSPRNTFRNNKVRVVGNGNAGPEFMVNIGPHSHGVIVDGNDFHGPVAKAGINVESNYDSAAGIATSYATAGGFVPAEWATTTLADIEITGNTVDLANAKAHLQVIQSSTTSISGLVIRDNTPRGSATAMSVITASGSIGYGHGAQLQGASVIDVASIPGASFGQASVTVAGAALGDILTGWGTSAALPAGVTILGGDVTAADTVVLNLFNKSGGALDPASMTYYASVRKRLL